MKRYEQVKNIKKRDKRAIAILVVFLVVAGVIATRLLSFVFVVVIYTIVLVFVPTLLVISDFMLSHFAEKDIRQVRTQPKVNTRRGGLFRKRRY